MTNKDASVMDETNKTDGARDGVSGELDFTASAGEVVTADQEASSQTVDGEPEDAPEDSPEDAARKAQQAQRRNEMKRKKKEHKRKDSRRRRAEARAKPVEEEGGGVGSGNEGSDSTPPQRPEKNGKAKNRFRMAAVERGRPNSPAVDYHFEIYSEEARRTFEESVGPASWRYRDILSGLARSGHGSVIGQVNTLLNEVTGEAVDLATKNAEKMETAIRRHEQAVGCELSLRDLGVPHKCTLTSVGGVSTKFAGIVKSFDAAVIKCKTAISADAAPYQVAQQAISEMIVRNRRILKCVNLLAEFVDRNLPQEKFSLLSLREEILHEVSRKPTSKESADVNKKFDLGQLIDAGRKRKEAEVEGKAVPKPKAEKPAENPKPKAPKASPSVDEKKVAADEVQKGASLISSILGQRK